MDAFLDQIRSLPPGLLLPVIALAVAVWFVPTLIAVFRNRANLGKIAAVNVPAGMSFLAWGALIVWAVSGKGTEAMPASVAGMKLNWGWVFAGVIVLIVLVSLTLGIL